MSAIRRRLQPLSKAKRIYLGLSGPRRRIPCPKCGNPIQSDTLRHVGKKQCVGGRQ